MSTCNSKSNLRECRTVYEQRYETYYKFNFLKIFSRTRNALQNAKLLKKNTFKNLKRDLTSTRIQTRCFFLFAAINTLIWP